MVLFPMFGMLVKWSDVWTTLTQYALGDNKVSLLCDCVHVFTR